MRPTRGYFLFELAEALGKTVREVLTGMPGPLTGMEFFLWSRYRRAQTRIRQQNEPPKHSPRRR